jgi:enamine deaminase RidA (YjgF/YER057c/UK114 family)
MSGKETPTMRRSIVVPGFDHGAQPIPAACRVGGLIATGGVYGLDPETGRLPDDVFEQARLMFLQLERVMAAAGASLGDIVRMTMFVKAPEARAAMNEQWIKAFPDAGSRPARHTLQNDHLPANMLIQCDALAMVSDHG